MPAAPTQATLIPIVTTAATCDAVALAEAYTARWPQQENIIRDFLIPLGIDTKFPLLRRETLQASSGPAIHWLVSGKQTESPWAAAGAAR